MFDGLVRRAIFANADRVMREDIGHGNFHQRTQAYGAPPVVTEDEEPGSEGSQLRECKTVQDGTHGMFSDSEVQVPARGAAGLEIACFREGQTRLGGWGKVGGTTKQPWKVRCDGVQNLGRRLASRNSLCISRKEGNIFRPVRGWLSLLDLLNFLRQLRKFLAVLGKLLFPLLAGFAASSSDTGCEVFVHLLGHQKLRIGRPSIGLLRQLDLLLAERLAVGSARILPVRGSVADVAVDDHKRRSAGRARGSPERILDAIQ